MNILIISASMGAGHDGAAHELRRRLEAEGHTATVKDYLAAMPLGIGPALRLGYRWELQFLPWGYDATYRMWYTHPEAAGPLQRLLATVTGRRLKRWIGDAEADAVVSTYPLASLALGRARQKGTLGIPVTTFITDFAVHPLWAAHGVDLHLAVHPRAAAAAHAQTGGVAAAPGPLVSSHFTSRLPDRDAARASLGIGADEKVALLVAGSWGVGAVRRTFDEILATGSWSPLAVCGRNDRLQASLESRGAGRVVGWTDDMPTLMAASDVLVENAGGLTCMEAFAASLPVVSYRAIAGHGRGNASEMEAAGVAAIAQPGHLLDALDGSLGARGDARRAAGRAMFAGDAAADIVEVATVGVPVTAPVTVPVGPAARGAHPARRHPILRPAAAAAMTLATLLVAVVLTSLGVGVAAAHGVAVAHPPRNATSIYLAVRLGPAAAADAALPTALAGDDITAVVSGQMAVQYPAFVARLAAAGCNVANGGWGHHRGLSWSGTWANADVERAAREIQEATGSPVRIFAPGRTVNGIELVSAHWSDQKVVLPNILKPANGALPVMKAGGVYLIEAGSLSGVDVAKLLSQIQALQAGGIHFLPLSALTG